MKDVFSWIVAHWQLLFLALLFLISTILQLVFKKKPIEVVSSVMEIIYEKVPEMISWYEKFYGAGHGSEKRASVIDRVMSEIERCYALTDNQRSLYKYFISNYIEVVLSTPQKK